MGQGELLPKRLNPEDEDAFPNLVKVGYHVTSHRSTRYNCIAHAADDTTRKWDCTMIPVPGYYWPPQAKRGRGIEALVSAFEAIGYEPCAGDHPEEGYQKVALYVDKNGFWSH